MFQWIHIVYFLSTIQREYDSNWWTQNSYYPSYEILDFSSSFTPLHPSTIPPYQMKCQILVVLSFCFKPFSLILSQVLLLQHRFWIFTIWHTSTPFPKYFLELLKSQGSRFRMVSYLKGCLMCLFLVFCRIMLDKLETNNFTVYLMFIPQIKQNVLIHPQTNKFFNFASQTTKIIILSGEKKKNSDYYNFLACL